jgi:hypothetical protein
LFIGQSTQSRQTDKYTDANQIIDKITGSSNVKATGRGDLHQWVTVIDELNALGKKINVSL